MWVECSSSYADVNFLGLPQAQFCDRTKDGWRTKERRRGRSKGQPVKLV